MSGDDTMETDVLIIGAGASGLAAAIRLATRARETGREINIMVLEKGAEVGAHILSGAAIETRALDELLPDWRERGAPVTVAVTEDRFCLLTKTKSIRLPTPPQMKNHGNYVISLGRLCKWLAEQAEVLGVQIMPGFPAASLLMENGEVQGVITGEFGVAKDGEHKPSYQPGIAIKARYTLFAEGCRGSLAEQLIHQYGLRENCSPQTYGIGIKELWEVQPDKHRPGSVTHTIGWPLDRRTYGGSFIYHADNNRVAIGFITGLDYTNPHLDPYMEFQRFKNHPSIRPLLEGGKRINYGARALSEGGLQSIPGLIFPGGAIIGDAAGFLNVPKIKGTHTAMKSGMLAADAIIESWDNTRKTSEDSSITEQGEARSEGVWGSFPHYHKTLTQYPELVRRSWLYSELHRARNIRPAFRLGLIVGLIYSALDTYLFRGRAPWTLKHHRADHETLKMQSHTRPIAYPKPDGVVTFDRMSSVYLSNTNHEEDQPIHLTLKDPALPIDYNLPKYAAPEQRYCPAGVYEIVEKEGAPALQINAQNCVHCKSCDIKDPLQNIVWIPPEGSGGPRYEGM